MKYQEITDFTESLSAGERSHAITFYNDPLMGDKIFDWEYGLERLQAEGGVYLSRLSIAMGFQPLTPYIQASCSDVYYCNLSIPATGRNPFAGGHAVAFVIDNQNKKFIYQDPWGTPPPDILVNYLADTTPEYEWNCLNVPQQKDIYSCGLISTLNLVALAKGNTIDPNIDECLWEIRGKHALSILQIQRQKIRSRIQQSMQAIKSCGGDIEEKKSSRFKVQINHRENFERAGQILVGIEQLNPDIPELPATLQLLIRLART